MIYYFLHNGQADIWWLRSPYDNADSVYIAHLNGNIGSGTEYDYYTNNSYGWLALSEHMGRQ